MQESKEWGWQRYMSNSFVMTLQNTAGAEADIKLLYIPGEDRAPQCSVFVFYTTMPTPAGKVVICPCLLAKVPQIFRITRIHIRRA